MFRCELLIFMIFEYKINVKRVKFLFTLIQNNNILVIFVLAALITHLCVQPVFKKHFHINVTVSPVIDDWRKAFEE